MTTLPPNAFQRFDDADDEIFYQSPRFVTHIDEHAIAAVTQLYREYFPPQGRILDLMSSWVSHLPTDVRYARVVGLGMNESELQANPQLDEYVVQNLNQQPLLPFPAGAFDGAAICVSIQYLTQPAAVLREVGRVLRDDAPLIVTFSNRCFPSKAVFIWQMLDDAGHAKLVTHYLQLAGNWRDMTTLDRTAPRRGADPLYAVIARAHTA